ncbi:hypothetical protein I4U23_017414 [Adineta vaga]|nr:hypothetical protein I4U23_017414 [Adineta vaga]
MFFFSNQRYRSLSLLKISILSIVSVLCVISLLTFYPLERICDPAEHLSWFCSWPDPQTTVCSWDDHFPTLTETSRTPQAYHNLFSSLPKRRSSFVFNNSTLSKCNESSIDLLIFVISKCSHGSIRQSIRRTWANLHLLHNHYKTLSIKLLFLVDNDSQSTQKILLENEYYQDIVQVINLPEQYEFVTQRESALYEFVIKRCQQTRFVFKTDDDIFINTFLLLSKVQSCEVLCR